MVTLTACRSGRHQYDHIRHLQCPHCRDSAAALWRAAHPETVKRCHDNWAMRNPEKYRLARKKYQDAHREKHATNSKRNKARLLVVCPDRVKVQNYSQAPGPGFQSLGAARSRSCNRQLLLLRVPSKADQRD
jgi:hypothetical protein